MPPASSTIDLAGLDRLVHLLLERGYEVTGPVYRDGVIELDQVRSADELPAGWTDRQGPGTYRTERRDDHARFGWAVGPQSWKRLLHAPRDQVWSIDRSRGGLEVRMHTPDTRRRAFLGVRPCELAAIHKQDTVLAGGPHVDPAYSARRADLCLIVVHCGEPADTCFCTSMGTGPAADAGYDLALTELVDGPGDTDLRYVTTAGSALGEELLAELGATVADDADLAAATAVTTGAAERITRRLDADGVREVLLDRLESPRWADIGERCLTCGNCTNACPTCFCTDLVDVTDLGGDTTDRWRVWDSCFSLQYSRLGPEPHRGSNASRYRQWMTHKLATWHDQFGESGCVGCGRCITWCPVGIDITAEAAAFADEPADPEPAR